jgi:predicted nuclease of predicted toxin-antitoxin system
MFIADENIDSSIIRELRNFSIEVLSIREKYPGISDEDIINLPVEQPKIIITEDKDFGEWVFAHQKKNISVILLRYEHKDRKEIIKILQNLLSKNLNEITGKFYSVSTKKVRIREIL